MIYSEKNLSQTVVDLCLKKGIDHIIISPGSRNAPLVIGFTSQESFTCYSIVDERCAAFFGLGMAQQLNKPVALVCTSGSAALNYYPAIAEAFYSDIPLVVITADRPGHLIDVGDGQTIRQENVFANHIEYSANCKEGENFQEYNEKEINAALNCAKEKNGPVHINVPFSEPLYGRISEKTVSPKVVAPKLILEDLDDSLLSELLKKWNAASRKMILVGTLKPSAIERNLIEQLATEDSVLVFTESTSNLHHENFFPAIDQLISSLTEKEFKKLQPEILLTFGGMVVSKRIKKFLRTYAPSEHWHVDPKTAMDTYFKLKYHLKYPINYFLKAFLQKTKGVKSNYQEYWLKEKEIKTVKHQKFESLVPYSDFCVYNEVFKSTPPNIMLQLANSTAIRYAQLFDLHPSLPVFCNRGTSGIDGSTSTAIGASVGANKFTLLVTGDLSFFYDSNALWNNYIPKFFRIILVNNGGGGIFRILPNAKEVAHFERFFETKHQLNASQLCEMFGFEYYSAHNIETLTKKMKPFYATGEKPKLMEVFTPFRINDEVLKEYFNAIS